MTKIEKQAEEQVKELLRKFTDNQVLTFKVERFKEEDEWIATCNQIPGIITGGTGNDCNEMFEQMRDAVLTAAGIDVKYAHCIYDASLKKPNKTKKGLLISEYCDGIARTQLTVAS